MKRLTMLCASALSLSLLAGCMITSPGDEAFQREFQEDWDESMEELKEDWEDAWDEWSSAWDRDRRSWEDSGKKHGWRILDSEGGELGTVMDEEQVKIIDALLSDDSGEWGHALAEAPGDPAYSYVYCQQETLKAGQKAEDRKYEELVRFTVSSSEDVVTLVILEDLPSLLNVDLGDLLTFALKVPAETAAALRDPAQFTQAK